MKYEVLDRAILEAITNTPGIKFDSLHRVRQIALESETLSGSPAEEAPAWRIVDRRLQALRKMGLIFAKNGWHPIFEEIK